MRFTALLVTLFLGTGAGVALLSQSGPETPIHGELGTAAACAPCHPADAPTRWESNRDRPCTSFCLTCHAKEEMAKHHPVGHAVSKQPRLALRLTQDRRSACFTCHDLSIRRYDGLRWKAESLFGRMFRTESRYKTYYLTTRNDRGQLCLSCH